MQRRFCHIPCFVYCCVLSAGRNTGLSSPLLEGPLELDTGPRGFAVFATITDKTVLFFVGLLYLL